MYHIVPKITLKSPGADYFSAVSNTDPDAARVFFLPPHEWILQQDDIRVRH